MAITAERMEIKTLPGWIKKSEPRTKDRARQEASCSSQLVWDIFSSLNQHGFNRLLPDPAQVAACRGQLKKQFGVLVDLGDAHFPNRTDTLFDPLLPQADKKWFGHGVIPTAATQLMLGTR